jgi:hypothetical protein
MSSRKTTNKVEKDKRSTEVVKTAGQRGKTNQSPPKATRNQKRNIEEGTKSSAVIDDQGFEMIESNKQKKGRRILEREESAQRTGAAPGRVRRTNPWRAKMLKPKGVVEEWKQVLEQGAMDLPRNFFEDRLVGANTGKICRRELENLIELYLFMLNTNHNMLEIFFTREETGWNILPASTFNAHYYNFRLILSAYCVKTITKIMKRHWWVNNTMELVGDTWMAAKESQIHLLKYLSPFNLQMVLYKQHRKMLRIILETFDQGHDAWDAMMTKAVQDYVDMEMLLAGRESREKFEDWSKGMSNSGGRSGSREIKKK